MRRSFLLCVLLTLGVSHAVWPQALRTNTQNLDEMGLEEIIVSSRRQPGSVIGDIEPELQLSARDIRNLGVSNVGELIQALGSQLGSGRGGGGGRPIVLVNGVRVASFREIRDLPSEAILRSDILPEEVAIKYGFPPTQRVLNIVLRPRFRAVALEADLGERAEGGRANQELEASWLRIQSPSRVQLETQWRESAALTERADPTRAILPEIRSRSLNAVVSRPLQEGWSGTMSASIDDRQSSRRLGVQDQQVVSRHSDGLQSRGSAQLQGGWRGWRVTASLNADREQTETETRISARTASQAESTTQTLDFDVLVSGTVGELPAGATAINLRAGSGERRIEALNFRPTNEINGALGDRRSALTRQRHDLRASLDLPLWSRLSESAGRQALTLNLNSGIEDLSDFDRLQTLGAGLNGRLTDTWRFLLSWTEEDNAPGMAQLGAPEVRTPAVRSFDFLRNETVFVTRIDGGNPLLLASQTRTTKAGVNGRPWQNIDLDFGIEYLSIDTDAVIGDLSLATAATATAFSERFVRDAQGRLLIIDARPLNLGDRRRSEWRWTLNLRRPWGPQLEPPMRGMRGGGRPDPAQFRAFARQGNWQLALTHTLRTSDSLQLATASAARLDLLGSDILFNDRGISRQEFDLRVNGARNGYGGRMNARWREGTRLGSGDNRLRVADHTTVDVRLFMDLGLQPFADGRDWLRGARVSLSIDNVFDQQPVVRDSTGQTPANYRPELLDPLGRYLELSVRKLFVPRIQPAMRGATPSGENAPPLR